MEQNANESLGCVIGSFGCCVDFSDNDNLPVHRACVWVVIRQASVGNDDDVILIITVQVK